MLHKELFVYGKIRQDFIWLQRKEIAQEIQQYRNKKNSVWETTSVHK